MIDLIDIYSESKRKDEERVFIGLPVHPSNNHCWAILGLLKRLHQVPTPGPVNGFNASPLSLATDPPYKDHPDQGIVDLHYSASKV